MTRVGYEARQEAIKLKELALQRQDDALRRARDAAASLHLADERHMSDDSWSTAITAPHASETRGPEADPYLAAHAPELPPYLTSHAPDLPPYPDSRVLLPPIAGLFSNMQIHRAAGQNPQDPAAMQPPLTYMPANQHSKSIEAGDVHRPPLMEVGADNYFTKEQDSAGASPIPVADRAAHTLPATLPAAPASEAIQSPSQSTQDKHLTFNNTLQFAEAPAQQGSAQREPPVSEPYKEGIPLPSREGTVHSRHEGTVHSRHEGTVHSRHEGESHSPDEDDGGYHSKSETEAFEGSQARSKKRLSKRGSLYRRQSIGKKFKVHKQNEMGEIVDKKGHRAWEMACGLQLGIRVNVSMSTNTSTTTGGTLPAEAPGSDPEFDRFNEEVKLKFPPGGSSITPPHEGVAFKFKDYAPVIFRNLRQVFGIDTADYMVALCNTQPDGSNALRIMGTPGKSGSLFFFSNDMRFIVKTLPKREALLLREILPAYYQHVKQNPGTYLPRFYGLHRWKPEYGRNVRFVVMNNVFATNMPIHRRFDLKGSTMGRSASASDKEKGHRCILKDLDFLELNDKIKLGAQRKKAFLDQIRSDCHLLMSLKIMDYSLLLGVHFEDGTEQLGGQPSMEELLPPTSHSVSAAHQHWARQPPTQPGSGSAMGPGSGGEGCADLERRPSDAASVDNPSEQRQDSVKGFGLHREDSQISRTQQHDEDDHDNPGVFHPGGVRGRRPDGTPVGHRYFIGIIDILMLYTRRKKIERVWKTMTEGEGASSQPPAKYAIRFCKFVESNIE